ncbi:hypothetical protein FT663_02036 [Candidozyma haemuli var. vulneris]|uniref:FAS1 domain-containing protein n=1 Tax=Candidozyma haemuli TaxID=45357 RepID=A0A2V1ALR3_9ASCO|nr:hypothetical protein CXQ85_001304 [[Candida] haemuloni]KAF3989985.1 hypothetical protein FT662_02549 [[Candida] haemuloni var. vulneris]KAF3993027.1 hypothetical protein FT663_02036 [[Candida] haemuloni var. vulneris]PVH19010.1 hypothetical protein CXQ85_001304 [[Candida] haemuloni]
MKFSTFVILCTTALSAVSATDRAQKREPKNIADLDALFNAYDQDHPQNEKRKNVANLENLNHLLQEDQENVENDKRDARRVVDPEALFHDKRDARRVVDPKSFFHEKIKRSQHVITAMQGPLVENVLTQVRDVSVFAGYLRDSESLLGELHSAPFAVIVAPTDHALASKLDGHKPWEFPREVEDENDASANIQDFVKSHLVKFEGDFSSIQDEVVLLSLDNKRVVIRHDAATDSFRVESGGRWIDVLAVYYADDGAVLVIDDSFVKPQ